MRSMCGADAGCLAINYQSLRALSRNHPEGWKSQRQFWARSFVPRNETLRSEFEEPTKGPKGPGVEKSNLWCFDALYYTHIVAPDTPYLFGAIKVSHE